MTPLDHALHAFVLIAFLAAPLFLLLAEFGAAAS